MVVVGATDVVETTDVVVDDDRISLPSLHDNRNEVTAITNKHWLPTRLGCDLSIFVFTNEG